MGARNSNRTVHKRYISRELFAVGIETLILAVIFIGTALWQKTHYVPSFQQAEVAGISLKVSASEDIFLPDQNEETTLLLSNQPIVIYSSAQSSIQNPIIKDSSDSLTPDNSSDVITIEQSSLSPDSCSIASADIEREIFAHVNVERSKTDMQSLQWSDDIADVAREHSLDMAEHGYFSHFSRNGQAPWDRAAKYGILIDAENIGMWGSFMDKLNDVVEGTVNLWMASRKHRINILGNFTRTGVGVICSANGYFITQEFR